MSSRRLVVLGTASQAPTRYRNHNGYLLRWDAEGILFDPGEGTQRQMLATGESVSSISDICITHFHGDHCLGLPGVLQRISLDRVAHPVTVHYPAAGEEFFARLRHASVYDDRADVRAAPVEVGTVPVVVGHVGRARLLAARLDHDPVTVGWRLEEPARRSLRPEALARFGIEGPAVGELLAAGRLRAGGRTVTVEEVGVVRPGQSVAFVMDTRPCEAAARLAAGVDLLVCESTFTEAEAHLAAAYGHMTARQAAELAAGAGARRVVLTHFSQRHPDADVYRAEAAALVDDVVVAEDLAVIAVPSRLPV